MNDTPSTAVLLSIRLQAMAGLQSQMAAGLIGRGQDELRTHFLMSAELMLEAAKAGAIMIEPVLDREAQYLIRKGGYYYRPNCQGYTANVNEAGRYTLAEAIKESHPNGPNGPRDGMSYDVAPVATASPAVAENGGALVAEVIDIARRDIARTQTDFLGRMAQALCEYEAVFDEHPDGDLSDTDQAVAEENIAALAGLALAQWAMLRHPGAPAEALSTPIAPAVEDGLVVVPREPTEAMIKVGASAIFEAELRDDHWRLRAAAAWSAMITAAPPAKGAGE